MLLLSHLGPLAQSVEQRTFNPWVVGSISTGPTSGFLQHSKDSQAQLRLGS
jgi:hypothetical protein